MAERFEVVDGLRVAFVDEMDDGEVVVDLYGGDAGAVCASVRFEFETETSAHTLASLQRWADNRTVVTYVAYGDYVTLVDAASVIRRGLDASVA